MLSTLDLIDVVWFYDSPLKTTRKQNNHLADYQPENH